MKQQPLTTIKEPLCVLCKMSAMHCEHQSLSSDAAPPQQCFSCVCVGSVKMSSFCYQTPEPCDVEHTRTHTQRLTISIPYPRQRHAVTLKHAIATRMYSSMHCISHLVSFF